MYSGKFCKTASGSSCRHIKKTAVQQIKTDRARGRTRFPVGVRIVLLLKVILRVFGSVVFPIITAVFYGYVLCSRKPVPNRTDSVHRGCKRRVKHGCEIR